MPKSKPLTVGDLRKLLEGLPADMLVEQYDSPIFMPSPLVKAVVASKRSKYGPLWRYDDARKPRTPVRVFLLISETDFHPEDELMET